MSQLPTDDFDESMAPGWSPEQDQPLAPIAAVTQRKAFNKLARITLVCFVFTFIAARALVLLIMLRIAPDMFLFVGHGTDHTHVHHLNYGIFLLSLVGGYLLLVGPEGFQLSVCAAIYGVGMALTFDEFGMWLHLGGSYWQRGSFDAVVVIAALLSFLVVMPDLKKLRSRHIFISVALIGASLFLAGLFLRSVYKLENRWGPRLQQIEQEGPAL